VTRECGDCKACCFHAEIDEIEKPAGEWCQHCDVKASLGCRIYDSRPQMCADFECAWLREPRDLPEEMWPRESRCLVTYLIDEETSQVTGYAIWPTHPNAHHTKKVTRWILSMASEGKRIVLADPLKRTATVIAEGLPKVKA